MKQPEVICQMLRDIGIFLIGLAAVAMTIHYLCFRYDPQTELQKVFTKQMIQGIQEPAGSSPKK